MTKYKKLLVRTLRVSTFLFQYYTKKFLFLFRLRLPLLKKLYVNTFPAVHIKKMDSWDYVWNFSSEILVASLVLTIAGFNLLFLKYPNQSIAANFLSIHVSQNPKLYEHISSTKTLVVQKTNPIIQSALADTAHAQDNQDAGAGYETQNNITISDTGIEAQNPDTVRRLLEKQLQIYVTQNGDTLGSVARKFNIDLETIIQANNLPGVAIKPGWNLVIPPMKGLIIRAGSNTTIPDLVKKYKGNQAQIIAYNGLESAEDIAKDDLIFVPDGIVPVTAKPKPSTGLTPKTTTIRKIGIDDEDGYTPSLGGHIFPKGYCTWYVAQHIKITFGGNAKAWPANAKTAGYIVTGKNEPLLGGVVVTNDDPRRGHVALVTAVTDTAIKVKEMNYVGFNKISERWIPRNSSSIKAYIHQ